jgi:endonuclease/exonuclease/phosphatase family metal-dependent hydrolase
MRKKINSKRSVGQWILLIFTIISVLCLIVSYVAFYLSPSAKLLYLPFFGLAYPVILIINIIFVLVWLFLWKRFIWIPLLAILIGFPHISALVQINLNPEKSSAGSLKIMSFNVHNLTGIESDKINKSIRSKVTTFLEAEKPDVLCLQEFLVRMSDTTQFLEKFKNAIQSKYFFHKNYNDLRDVRTIDALATFSRYPMFNEGILRFPKKHVFAIYSDIIIEDEKIRVYNVHLESIHFANDDYSFYASLTDSGLEKSKITDGSAKIIEKLSKAFILRAQQVEVLKTSINTSPYPVIVCGDFNDTPSSYTYNKLTSSLYDAFRKAGTGFLGSTYSGNFPSFRIDYILYDKNFKAYEYQTYPVNLSDHYPISVYLNITPVL